MTDGAAITHALKVVRFSEGTAECECGEIVRNDPADLELRVSRYGRDVAAERLASRFAAHRAAVRAPAARTGAVRAIVGNVNLPAGGGRPSGPTPNMRSILGRAG